MHVEVTAVFRFSGVSMLSEISRIKRRLAILQSSFFIGVDRISLQHHFHQSFDDYILNTAGYRSNVLRGISDSLTHTRFTKCAREMMIYKVIMRIRI